MAGGKDELKFPFFNTFPIEFWGSLVPGLIFLLLTLPFAAILVLKVTYLGRLPAFDVWAPLKNARVETIFVTMIVSYIVGRIFYRLDQKRPDSASCRKILGKYEANDKKSWVEKDVARDEIIEYPYRNLKAYYQSRQMHHLADLVPWEVESRTVDGVDKDVVQGSRSKNFINILKIRLGHCFPRSIRDLTKIEADIRLMSSTWWAALVLSWFFALYLGLAVGLIACAFIGGVPVVNTDWLIIGVVASLLVLMCGLKATIEKFLHYQRVREITFVLENAYIASKTKPEILQGLVDPVPGDGSAPASSCLAPEPSGAEG